MDVWGIRRLLIEGGEGRLIAVARGTGLGPSGGGAARKFATPSESESVAMRMLAAMCSYAESVTEFINLRKQRKPTNHGSNSYLGYLHSLINYPHKM